MAGNPKQKLKLLYIADFLRSSSDSEHPVSTTQISEYLAAQGIGAERKSIYNDIAILIEYGLPIERVYTPSRGYYLSDGTFEISELMMLVDAVQASPVITAKKTKLLTQKLCSLASKYQTDRLSNHIYINDRTKSTNEEIYYNLDRINSCINSGRKVRFIYQRRQLVGNLPVYDAGREFIISPYATIWNEDKYYLVGNYDKYDDLSHYRIDRMRHVESTRERARDFREVTNYTTRFDAADYSRKVFNMFSGTNQRTVELICENRLLEPIIERFGINIPYRQLDEGHFSVKTNVMMSDGLVNWIINFGGGVVVRAPAELRVRVKEKLEQMLGSYSD